MVTSLESTWGPWHSLASLLQAKDAGVYILIGRSLCSQYSALLDLRQTLLRVQTRTSPPF